MEVEEQQVQPELDAYTESSFSPKEPYSFGRDVLDALEQAFEKAKQQQAAERRAQADISRGSSPKTLYGLASQSYRLGRRHAVEDRQAAEVARAWARRLRRRSG